MFFLKKRSLVFPQLFLKSTFITAITCHDPGALTHGQRSTNVNFTFGTVLTYTCDVGYTIKGSSSSTCRIDGLWSNRKPECERMYSTLRLSQNPYLLLIFLVLNANFVCTFVITAVQCSPIRIPQHGSKEGDVYEYSKTITFACFPGYSLEGSKNTTCKEDGTWTNPTPTCRGKQSCGTFVSN